MERWNDEYSVSTEEYNKEVGHQDTKLLLHETGVAETVQGTNNKTSTKTSESKSNLYHRHGKLLLLRRAQGELSEATPRTPTVARVRLALPTSHQSFTTKHATCDCH